MPGSRGRCSNGSGVGATRSGTGSAGFGAGARRRLIFLVPPDAPLVRVSIVRRGSSRSFCLPQRDRLSSRTTRNRHGCRAAATRARCVACGRRPAAGHDPGLSVRRGVDRRKRRSSSGMWHPSSSLAQVRAVGWDRARKDRLPAANVRRFQAIVEDARPLRGSDLATWRYNVVDHVAGPRRPHNYAARSAAAPRPVPRAPPGGARTAPANATRTRGALFRLTPATLGPKVAWHDLALTLEAVALPTRVRGTSGRDVPLIPLNTVYFIPTRDHDQALLLAAYLNSLPVQTFARAIAERAKDAHFRFLAWTIALVPLPRGWDAGPTAARLVEISARAHGRGAIETDEEAELNAIVAAAFGLTSDDVAAIREFDLWLRGIPR